MKNWLPILHWGAEAARFYIDPQGTLPLDLSTPEVAGLGTLQIPYPNGRMLINFYGPPGTFPKIPMWKAVKGNFKPERCGRQNCVNWRMGPHLP